MPTVFNSKRQTESSAGKSHPKQTGLQRQTPSQTREVSRRIPVRYETIGSVPHLEPTGPSTVQRLLFYLLFFCLFPSRGPPLPKHFFFFFFFVGGFFFLSPPPLPRQERTKNIPL